MKLIILLLLLFFLWVYYLASFHSYAEAVLADTESFQEKLTEEMKDWLEKHSDDESVPEVSCFLSTSNFTPLCLSSPRRISGYRHHTAGG